jgi:hypothetical protein
MKILENVISTLHFDASARDIRQGIFHTAVLTRNCGLAATLPRDALKQQHPYVKETGFLLDRSPQHLVQMAYSETILEAAIGMATINSLLDVDMAKCVDLNARDLIAEKGNGKRIAIVGHFPFVSQLEKVATDLWVIEKNPRGGDLAEEAAENFIPMADVVGITGTAFTNHSLQPLLQLCRTHAFVTVLGDTAPLSPVLFDYHIDAVSGTKVIDTERVLRSVSQGANYRQIQGVRRLTIMK